MKGLWAGLFAVVPVLVLGATFANASIRPSPSEFLTLAKSGLNGTFSATYAVHEKSPGGSISPFGDSIVTIGQRSAPDKSAWLHQSGEWYFRIVSSSGKGDEWKFDGTSFYDCTRKSSTTPWSCTGPGRFDEYKGGNNYTYATSPFLPGFFLSGINGAVDFSSSIPTTSINSMDQPCLQNLNPKMVWCLDSSGHVSSWSSASPDPGIFLWTSARIISESSSATKLSFNLPAKPHFPFVPYMGEP